MIGVVVYGQKAANRTHQKINEMKQKYSRRDLLKGMAGVPFLGYFASRFYVSQKESATRPKVNWSKYGISEYDPDIIPALRYATNGNKIRVGVVGNGGRGAAIFRALGYAQESWASRFIKNGSPTSLLKNFLDQDDLNIEITGVCDTYTGRAESAAATVVANSHCSGKKCFNAPAATLIQHPLNRITSCQHQFVLT